MEDGSWVREVFLIKSTIKGLDDQTKIMNLTYSN